MVQCNGYIKPERGKSYNMSNYLGEKNVSKDITSCPIVVFESEHCIFVWQFDVTVYMESLFGETIPMDENIIVYAPSYLEKLRGLLTDTPKV